MRAAIAIAAAAASGALFLGCNNREKPDYQSAVAAANRPGEPGQPTVALGSTIAVPWEPVPTLKSGLGSGGGPATWYVDNVPGNPLKTHTAEEATKAGEVLFLLNDQRTKAGLPLLQNDPGALKAAKAHAEDMAARNFFDHNTPEGRTPVDRLKILGVVGHRTAGENIATTFETSQAVIDTWLKSESHRKNMLSSDFTHVGVGYTTKGPNVVAVFLGKGPPR